MNIRSGRAENNVAKEVRDAFAATLELIDSSAQNVSVKIEVE